MHFALTVAQAELARSAARRRSAVLLTDAVHNAGPDPRLVARRFPELHVLLQTDGEHDAALGADLARLGRGRFAPVRPTATWRPRSTACWRANPKASLHFRGGESPLSGRRVFISGARVRAARVIASIGT